MYVNCEKIRVAGSLSQLQTDVDPLKINVLFYLITRSVEETTFTVEQGTRLEIDVTPRWRRKSMMLIQAG